MTDVEPSEFTSFIDDIFSVEIIECGCVLPKLKPKADPRAYNDKNLANRAYHASVVWDIYITLMATLKTSPVYPMFETIFYVSLYNMRRTEFQLIDLQLYYKNVGFLTDNKSALYEFAFIIFDTRNYIAAAIKSNSEKYNMISNNAPLCKLVSFCDNQIHAMQRLLDKIEGQPSDVYSIGRRLSLCIKNLNRIMRPIPKK